MRIIECLIKTLRDSAIFNPEVQVAPSCILWPDKDRQWEAVISRLQSELGELLVLGDYVPESRVGPAIWLRCVIAGKAPDVTLPAERVPVFYLPGVNRCAYPTLSGDANRRFFVTKYCRFCVAVNNWSW